MAESLVPGTGLSRALCVVVFIVMLAALVYAAWIGVATSRAFTSEGTCRLSVRPLRAEL